MNRYTITATLGEHAYGLIMKGENRVKNKKKMLHSFEQQLKRQVGIWKLIILLV